MSVIDFATEKVVATWGVPGGGSPDMGNISADGRYLWLAARYDDVVYRFDTVANSWTRGPDLPGARGAGAMVIVGRELHFWGGLINRDFDSDAHWRLNLDNVSAGWVTDTKVPEGVNHQGGVVVNGKIYSVGGMAD